MHYIFYGKRQHWKYEFRKHDYQKDYHFWYEESDRNKMKVRSHLDNIEIIKMHESRSDFDYTTVQYVELKGQQYNISSIVKIVDSDVTDIHLNYVESVQHGKEDAEKLEEEYNRQNKQIESAQIAVSSDNRNWFKKIFHIK